MVFDHHNETLSPRDETDPLSLLEEGVRFLGGGWSLLSAYSPDESGLPWSTNQPERVAI